MAPIEPKVKQGAVAGGAVGVAAWALMTLVPAWRDGVPDPVLAALPFVLAWLGHVLAAYRAPHDASRDVVIPVTVPLQDSGVTVLPPAPAVPPAQPAVPPVAPDGAG